MIDLIGGLVACALLFGFVVGPLAWVSGTWDSPVDEATKHYPRARAQLGSPRPPRRSAR